MPNFSDMEYSSGKKTGRATRNMRVGTRWFPCYGNATSAWFLHQPWQILVNLVLWRWALLGCKRTNKENTWVTEILLTLRRQQVGFIRVMGSPGRNRSREENKPFKTARPEWWGALLHTRAHRPRLLSPMGLWLPGGCKPQSTSHFRRQRAGLTHFQAVPSCYGAHNLHIIWHTTSNSAKADRIVSNWKHVKPRMYHPENTKTCNAICLVWCVSVLINQISQKNVTRKIGFISKSPICKLPCENHKPDFLAPLPVAFLT